MTPLPYELCLIDEAFLLSAPVHIKRPAQFLEPYKECREYAAELLDGATTLQEAISILTKHEDTLLDMDRSYVHDLEWLRKEAPKKLQTKIDELVLACFPTQGEAITYEDAGTELREVMKSAKAIALGVDYGKELIGIAETCGVPQQWLPSSDG